jgi:hypothetical protein
MLEYSRHLVHLLSPVGIICGNLMHIVKILCIFPIFGILCQEKSGNPGSRTYEVHKRIEVVIFDCCDLFPSRVQSRIINYFFTSIISCSKMNERFR